MNARIAIRLEPEVGSTPKCDRASGVAARFRPGHTVVASYLNATQAALGETKTTGICSRSACAKGESGHEINTVCWSTIIKLLVLSAKGHDAHQKSGAQQAPEGKGLTMKLGALLGALLMLLGITSASATIRIHDDPGGRIDRYLQRFAKLRNSGERIIVDGTCNSACTLLLGTIPRSRICVTERASLGFHAAWVFDGQGNQVESPTWTSVLWRNYPQTIRTWIKRNGGLTPRMIFLRGNELMAMYPLCT